MSLEISSPQNYSGTTVASYPDILVLSDSLVISTYTDNTQGYVIAGTINANDTITWGDPVVLNYQKHINIIKLDATNFVLLHSSENNSSNTTGRLYFRVCSVSGTTISLSATQDWGSDIYSPFLFNVGAGLSASSFVVIYNNNNTGGLKMRACTISGGVITFGSETSVDRSSGYLDIIALSSSSFAIVYYNYSYLYVRVGTVDTRTITLGSAVNIGGVSPKNSLSKLSDSSFVVSYMGGETSNSILARICTVSGTTVTAGNSATLKSAATYGNAYPGVCALSSTVFLMVYAYRFNNSSSNGYVSSWSVSGTTISALDTPVQVGSFDTSFIRIFSNLLISSSKAIMSFSDASNSSYGKTSIVTFSAPSTFVPKIIII